jgi:peptide/nickel transport system permease protein
VLKLAGRRLLLAIPTIILTTFLVFVLMELSPQDPAATLAGENATPEALAEARTVLGLDRPFLERYLAWGWDAIRGNLGVSPISHQDVLTAILTKLPITGSLLLLALIFTLIIGLVLGTAAALNRNKFIDRLSNVVASLLMSLPPFVSGIVLATLFALTFRLFPATGFAPISQGLGPWLQFTTLPALALALIPAALLTRQVRGALVDALEEDYIRTARAKGLSRLSIVGKHAAKNAAIPAVTVLGLAIVQMVSGTVVVEKIFAIPGIGSLSVDTVLTGDLIMLQGIVLVIAVVVTIVNLLVDTSYGLFNPRLRTR